MVKIRKYANGIERFLHGEKGQRFFNFAYSIGAAVVIWGALFKILHLPGGSTLLCIGMGTEIAMFILTAFDRPPKEYAWEDVFPVLDTKNPEDRPDFAGGGGGVVINGGYGVPGAGGAETLPEYDATAGTPGGTVIAGGGFAAVPGVMPSQEQLDNAEEMADATKTYLEQMQGISEQMGRLNETTEALNQVTQTLLQSYQAITLNSENISANSQGYVGQMEDLNRNIAGLNTIYEIQLKSVSSQLDAIDRVNRGIKDICQMYEHTASQSSRYCEESEKMTRYMQQLNQVYAQMLRAMTINMGAAGVAVAPAQANADNATATPDNSTTSNS